MPGRTRGDGLAILLVALAAIAPRIAVAQAYGPMARMVVTRAAKAEGRATFVELSEGLQNALPQHCTSAPPPGHTEHFLITALHVLTSWQAAHRGRPHNTLLLLGGGPDRSLDITNRMELCLSDRVRDLALVRVVSDSVPRVAQIDLDVGSSPNANPRLLGYSSLDGRVRALRLDGNPRQPVNQRPGAYKRCPAGGCMANEWGDAFEQTFDAIAYDLRQNYRPHGRSGVPLVAEQRRGGWRVTAVTIYHGSRGFLAAEVTGAEFTPPTPDGASYRWEPPTSPKRDAQDDLVTLLRRIALTERLASPTDPCLQVSAA